MEILQMLVSNPKYLILDEIDSGLDIDALQKISLKINTNFFQIQKIKKEIMNFTILQCLLQKALECN